MVNDMKKFAIFRHSDKKFHTMSEISNAERHNKRTMDVPNAAPNGVEGVDFRRVHGGNSATGTLKILLKKHNIKPRKNAALAMEYLMTYSPEMKEKIPLDEWIEANLEFLRVEHGEGVLCVDLHLDETTPHLQAIVAPLIEKEVRGKLQMRLSGVDFWKGKYKLSSRQDRYADAMSRFGLERGLKGSKSAHRTIKEFYKMLDSLPKNELNNVYNHIKKLEGNEVPRFWDLKKSWNKLKDYTRKTLIDSFRSLKKVNAFSLNNRMLKEDNQQLKEQNSYLTHALDHSQEAVLEDKIELLEKDLEQANKVIYQQEIKAQVTENNNNIEVAGLNDTIKTMNRLLDKYSPHCDNSLNL